MDMYCTKCKIKTKSVNVETVKTVNEKWRLKAQCNTCDREKSRFIAAPKGSGLEESKPHVNNIMLEARELHRPVVRRFPKRRIITLGIDDLWAADLVIMDRYSHENDGYKYILNVIDTFSKYAWSEPLVRKSGSHVTDAFRKIINKAFICGHTSPNLLHTDKGREFLNKEFRSLLQEHTIKMYHTENEEKSSIVERFNRTLNERMKVQFEARKSFRWIDILQPLLKDYNSSFHRTIGMMPIEVNANRECEIKRRFADMEKTIDLKPKFAVGDRVRITKRKEQYANKYGRNWTREVFTVSQVNNTNPVTYRIKDATGEEIIGSFYQKELQKSQF